MFVSCCSSLAKNDWQATSCDLKSSEAKTVGEKKTERAGSETSERMIRPPRSNLILLLQIRACALSNIDLHGE